MANLDLVQLQGLLARPEGNGIPAAQGLSTIRCSRDVSGGGAGPAAAVKLPPQEEPAPQQLEQGQAQAGLAGGEAPPQPSAVKPEQLSAPAQQPSAPAQQPSALAEAAAAGKTAPQAALPVPAKQGPGVAAARKARSKPVAVKEEGAQAPALAASQPAARGRAGARGEHV